MVTGKNQVIASAKCLWETRIDPLYLLTEFPQVVVARPDLDTGVGHSDDRPAEIRIGEANRLQHGAGWRAARSLGYCVATFFHSKKAITRRWMMAPRGLRSLLSGASSTSGRRNDADRANNDQDKANER